MSTRLSLPFACCLALALGCGTASNQTDQSPPVEPQQPPPATVTPQVVNKVAVDDLEDAFKRAIAKAEPAVVSIYSSKTVALPGFGMPLWGDPFERFFDVPGGRPRELQQHGLGSGVIIDANGHILTNNHVIDGAQEIRVQLADDREFDAQVVGTDPATDLALLKIDADNLHPLEFGDSDVIEVGDWVLAIGNPFNLPRTVSVGIVSATGRANVGITDYENFIQTDAAINPGNSGGPLVDLEGRVVGINTAIASRGGGNNGIAFAVPANMAKLVVDQLISDGKVTRGYLGIAISELSPELAASFAYEGDEGILVQDVGEGSAGERAGLRHGDVILELDGKVVRSVPQFRQDIAQRRPGASVDLEVWRAGKHEQLRAQLSEAPGVASMGVSPIAPSSKLGIELRDLDARLRKQLGVDEGAVVISRVEPGSPAAAAGLRSGDILEQVEREQVHDAAQAANLLSQAKLDGGVLVRIRRGEQGRYVVIKTKQ